MKSSLFTTISRFHLSFKEAIRSFLPSGLVFSDKIALLALLLAIPPTLDLLVRSFSTGSILVTAPRHIDFRASVVPVMKNGKWKTINGEREIKPEISMSSTVNAITTLTYQNTAIGDAHKIIHTETLEILDGERVIYAFSAWKNTQLVPAHSRHWWWGDIQPWLPVILGGGEWRNGQVIMGAKLCPSDDCSWRTFVEFSKNAGQLFARVSVEDSKGKLSSSDLCTLRLKEIPSKLGKELKRKNAYKAGISCNPI